jgi:two-component system, NarL family, sensor histidine kinase UhpB
MSAKALTVVLLGLKTLQNRVPAEVRAELATIRATARDGLDDVRRVVARLRPGVLEDLGLHGALSSLCTDLRAVGGIEVDRSFGRGLPRLSPEAELVNYRMAQEALTNVAWHARASRISVSLTRVGNAADDGVRPWGARPGTGIVGMRERALLVGGGLTWKCYHGPW